MINSQNRMNINFGSRIHFCTANQFEKWVDIPVFMKQKKLVYGDFQIKDAITANKAVTINVIDCVVGGISGLAENKMFLSHIIPDWGVKNFESVADAIEKIAKGSKNIKGLLVGGVADDKESMKLMKKFSDLFKKLEIDYSSFLGQKENGFIGVKYDSTDDKWLINVQSEVFDRLNAAYKSNYGHWAKGNYSPKNLEEIKNYFSEVKISPNDNLKIN